MKFLSFFRRKKLKTESIPVVAEEIITSPKLSSLHPLSQEKCWTGQFKAMLNLIPVVGGTMAQEVQNFQDYRTMELFRNFVAFVMEMIDTTEEERKEFADEVAEKANDSSGNVIVNMVDKLDSIHKQKVFANLSKARINKELSIEDFFRIHSILVRIPYVDLESLSKYSKPYYDYDGDSELLFATGALKLASISSDKENLYVLSHLGESLLEFGLKKKVDVDREKGMQMDVSGAVLDDKEIGDSISERAGKIVDDAMTFQML